MLKEKVVADESRDGSGEKGKLKGRIRIYGGEKKEIGEAVNRGPCICHLLGSIVTPPFFPHNDAPFRHNYRHYS